MPDSLTKLLGWARADLTALPDLIDELSRCLTEKPQITGGSGGKPGSKAPLRLEVLHLDDSRRKPGWEGEDPRRTKWNLTWVDGLAPDGSVLQYSRTFTLHEAAMNAYENLTWQQQMRATIEEWKVRDEYGIAPLLELWTRVVAEEMDERPELAEVATVRSECAVLVEHWAWISQQQWAEELAEDVHLATIKVRLALGERREYTPRCRSCSNRLTPMDNGTWYACPGCGRDYTYDAELKALGQVQEGTLADISQLLTVPVKTLHRWYAEKLIKPAGLSPRGKLFTIEDVRQVAERVRVGKDTA